MPRFRVHADYDRDGRIGASASEQLRARSAPGAVVAPNVDTDDAGNAFVRPGRRRLDRDLSRKSGRDNDVAQIVIEVVPGSEGVPDSAVLRIEEADARRLRIFDPRGAIRLGLDTLGGRLQRQTDIQLTRGREQWRIEAVAVNGAPISFSPVVGQLRTQQAVAPFLPIHLTLEHRDSRGQVTSETAVFSISPFLLPQNGWEAREIYIAEFEANQPTVAELRAALRHRRIRSEIRTVSQVDANNDAWLQDQFLQGYFETPRRVHHTIVHLPRLSRNALPGSAGNLSRFVSERLPNPDRGLVEDFHDRTMRVRLRNGRVQQLSLVDSHALAQIFADLSILERRLIFWARRLMAAVPLRAANTDVRRRLAIVLQLLERVTSGARQNPERLPRDSADDLVSSLRQSTDHLLERLVAFPGQVTLIPRPGLSLMVDPDEIALIADEIDREHSGFNFGGNIETAPPSAGFPLGRIVVGTQDQMLEPLVDFLDAQAAQPLLSVDTSWLRVGHVDEILCFAPRPGGHCVMIASPEVALRILASALQTHEQGLPSVDRSDAFDPAFVPSQGRHPITRLLRGRFWLHSDNGTSNPVEPPAIYIRTLPGIATWPDPVGSGSTRVFRAAPGPDRFYRADIGVAEVLHVAAGDNLLIASHQELELKRQLSREFPGVPILPLPVLFDLPSDATTTIAFTPDLVNCLVLNAVVVMPRPYGPRVPIGSVAPMLAGVLPSSAGMFLSEARLRAARLDQFTAWMNSKFADYPLSYEVLAERFDGLETFFQLSHDEFRDRLLAQNQRMFERDRNDWLLRTGWHQLRIPERSVDLFEAYCFALLSSVGLTVEFVDSWFYHVRDGGLHCGTNIQYIPPATRMRWWQASP
jgi:hypothetical protein